MRDVEFAVLRQFRNLLSAAIILKEKFDLNEPVEVLYSHFELLKKDLNYLETLVPKEILAKGSLYRHFGWIEKRLSQRKPDDCYGDVTALCLTDIFVVEKYYFSSQSNLNESIVDKNEEEFDSEKWEKINSRVKNVAKSRFDTKHYADAVEAAFKEINNIVKQEYSKHMKKEKDGDNLMKEIFSCQNPVFVFDNINTESGKNIQQGYMEIFAGAIKGIRNPKAHANLDVHPDEAWELIVLASHLMRMWEKARHVSTLENVLTR